MSVFGIVQPMRGLSHIPGNRAMVGGKTGMAKPPPNTIRTRCVRWDATSGPSTSPSRTANADRCRCQLGDSLRTLLSSAIFDEDLFASKDREQPRLVMLV